MITLSQPIQTRAERLIESWVRQSQSVDLQQRRQNRRFPFFRTVSMDSHEGQVEAFSRDISPTGIGLLHSAAINPDEELTLAIRLLRREVKVTVRTAWCRPCAPGWFISGASFLDLGLIQGTPLLAETIRHELERRWQQRYPLFRKIGLSAVGLTEVAEKEELHTFSLDVSPTGIGVLARYPIPQGPAVIQTEDLNQEPLDLRVRAVWCQERGHGWYVSGCRFDSLSVTDPSFIR